MARFGAVLAAATALGGLLVTPSSASACTPQASPNPIAKQYPDLVSGTLNGTSMIVPISMETARQVIPTDYKILEGAFRSLLPDFPGDMYPMLVLGLHDHDIQLSSLGISVPDFTRSSLEFPFLDILGDGYSSFRWGSTNMITQLSPAILGAEGYGIKVYPATFDPECDAYKATSSPGETSFTAKSSGLVSRSMSIQARPSPDEVPYSLEFMRNITNQPLFANKLVCDNYMQLHNTSLGAPPNEPVPVRGTVKAKLEPFEDREETWGGVFGWRMSTAFLEHPTGMACSALKGYHGTGPGDSSEF